MGNGALRIDARAGGTPRRGGYAAEAYVLSQSAFGQKLQIFNQLYAHQLAAAADDDHFVNPVFARRLRARLGHDPDTAIVEASVQEISLSADLVCLAEVLYLVPDHCMALLERLKAQYLLTSYVGAFDAQVSTCLRHFGWRNIVTEQVLPRFEPVDGATSYLVIRRPGSQVRLWQQV
jgi:hypothetical protein